MSLQVEDKHAAIAAVYEHTKRGAPSLLCNSTMVQVDDNVRINALMRTDWMIHQASSSCAARRGVFRSVNKTTFEVYWSTAGSFTRSEDNNCIKGSN